MSPTYELDYAQTVDCYGMTTIEVEDAEIALHEALKTDTHGDVSMRPEWDTARNLRIVSMVRVNEDDEDETIIEDMQIEPGQTFPYILPQALAAMSALVDQAKATCKADSLIDLDGVVALRQHIKNIREILTGDT